MSGEREDVEVQTSVVTPRLNLRMERDQISMDQLRKCADVHELHSALASKSPLAEDCLPLGYEDT